MRLEDHLHPDRIVLGLTATDRTAALEALAGALVAGGVGASAERLARALEERERDHPTVLGRGLAIPHAVLPELEEPATLVAVAARPIPFAGPGHDPVEIFFTLVSPPGREGDHVRLLARICRLARRGGFLEGLRTAESAEAALAHLRAADREEG